MTRRPLWVSHILLDASGFFKRMLTANPNWSAKTRWQPWVVTKSSMPYTKVDQRTLKFPVQIPADSSAEIQYSVRYQFE